MANKLSLHSTLSLCKPCKHCDVIEDKLYRIYIVITVSSFQYKIYIKPSLSEKDKARIWEFYEGECIIESSLSELYYGDGCGYTLQLQVIED